MNMSSTNFNMRLDRETKEQLEAILNEYGLTVPQAFKMFAHQVIRTRKVPLTFDDRAEHTHNEKSANFHQQ